MFPIAYGLATWDAQAKMRDVSTNAIRVFVTQLGQLLAHISLKQFSEKAGFPFATKLGKKEDDAREVLNRMVLSTGFVFRL